MTKNNDWVFKWLSPAINGLILAGITGVLITLKNLSVDIAVIATEMRNQKQINQDQKERDRNQDEQFTQLRNLFLKPEEVHEKTD